MQAINAIWNSSFKRSETGLIMMAARLRRDIMRRRERRRAAHYLRTLSDYHLYDIGIRRSDILSAVFGETGTGPWKAGEH